MSASYKAVFVLSLVMIPISMFLSFALSGGKGGASMAAIWWSFTAWYMYKRDNKSLVSQQWFLIWIQGVVGTLLFLLLILDEDLRNSLDYTPIGIVLTLAVSIPLNYGLLVFFQKQISPADAVTSTDTPSHNVPYRPTDTSPSVIHMTPTPATNTPTASTPTPSTAAYTPSRTDPYQQAGEEVLSGKVDPAIWARSLVEGTGNDGAVKAAYVKLRVAQLNKAIEAEADRARDEQERLALNEKITDYASHNSISTEEAGLFLVYGIFRFEDKYAYFDGGGCRYTYEKLEDALAYAKKVHPNKEIHALFEKIKAQEQ